MDLLADDRALLDAFRRGDVTALTAVYRGYAGELFAMLVRGFRVESQGRTFWFAGYRHGVELEDAVQEVFARAFTEPARLRYDGLRPYRNYLFTMARNLVIDELRKRQRVFVPIGNDAPDAEQNAPPLVDTAPGPLEQKLEREVQVVVDAFLAELDELERRVFETRFQGGASVEDTAKALEISEYKVKRLEKQLRRRFYATMRGRGYFDGYALTAGAAMVLALMMGGVR